MELSFSRRWFFYIPVSIHAFLILLLTTYTSLNLPPSILPGYLILSAVFLISTLFSLHAILRLRTGVFHYLLNIMFLLGFWLKYSAQKITSLNYPEPIGAFALNSEAEAGILWVVIYGVTGFILSQTCSCYLFKKHDNSNEEGEKHPLHKKLVFFLLALALLFTLLNLKLNILLCGLKPSLILPFKGNAVYFLALTKGIIFLFFFYCFKTYSNKMVFWGALIASVCSIGVLSRMIVIAYFAVIFVFILQNMAIWRFEKTLRNILLFFPVFTLFSYLTVLGSTGLRNVMYANQYSQTENEIARAQIGAIKDYHDNESKPGSVPRVRNFDFKKKLQVYKELALGRWIGMEGVMAVDSYPKKSFVFLWEALKEKSYHGVSFYTKISNPGISSVPDTTKVTSTSVPGPIAFFYYSGSRLFVFFAIFLSTFLLSAVEQLVFKLFNKAHAVVVFISTSMVFDFFQFGISPLAFVRYWGFLLFSIIVFAFLSNTHSKKDFI